MDEMVTTEMNYVHDLSEVIEGYLMPLQIRARVLPFSDKHLSSLFGNLTEIRDFHRSAECHGDSHVMCILTVESPGPPLGPQKVAVSREVTCKHMYTKGHFWGPRPSSWQALVYVCMCLTLKGQCILEASCYAFAEVLPNDFQPRSSLRASPVSVSVLLFVRHFEYFTVGLGWSARGPMDCGDIIAPGGPLVRRRLVFPLTVSGFLGGYLHLMPTSISGWVGCISI